jgi:hypothetical protein
LIKLLGKYSMVVIPTLLNYILIYIVLNSHCALTSTTSRNIFSFPCPHELPYFSELCTLKAGDILFVLQVHYNYLCLMVCHHLHLLFFFFSQIILNFFHIQFSFNSVQCVCYFGEKNYNCQFSHNTHSTTNPSSETDYL